MPTFDYVCKDCKQQFEFFHMHKTEKAVCPACDSDKVEKQISKPLGHVVNGANAKNRYGLKR